MIDNNYREYLYATIIIFKSLYTKESRVSYTFYNSRTPEVIGLKICWEAAKNQEKGIGYIFYTVPLICEGSASKIVITTTTYYALSIFDIIY